MTYRTFRFPLIALFLFMPLHQAAAHSDAGNRAFLTTMTIDDPGVGNEVTLPQVTRFKSSEDGHDANWETEVLAEAEAALTQNFGISVGGAYVEEDARHDDSRTTGFDNVELGAKYVFLTNDPHELTMAAGLDWDIGGSGAKRIGAENFSTLTPTLYAGKGMGDLPDSVWYLQPLAVTGQFGVAVPTQAHSGDEANPTALDYGATLQYSLPYLQQHVKDMGLPRFIGQLTPLVEFAFDSPQNNGTPTTGTINPGVLWNSGATQIGVEAVLPATAKSGQGVGFNLQAHFYLDDMFPKTFGKPLFD